MATDNNTDTSLKKRSKSTKNIVIGNLYMLIASLFFGVNMPVIKLLIPDWMTSMDVTVFRIAGGCLLMWIASFFIRRDKIERRDWWRIIVGGAVGLFSFMYLFNLSLRYADPIDVSIIMTFTPVLVIIMGIVFMHRHTSWLEIIGVIVAFIGAFLVIVTQHTASHNPSDHRLLGDLLAVGATACYALYLIILEGPTKRYNTPSLLKWVFLMACVPTLFLLPEFMNAEIFSTLEFKPWAYISFVIIGPTFLTFLLINPSINLIGSDMVSMYQNIVPAFTIVASVLMGVSSIQWIQIIAIVIIIAGMIITNMAKKRQRKNSTTTKCSK